MQKLQKHTKLRRQIVIYSSEGVLAFFNSDHVLVITVTDTGYTEMNSLLKDIIEHFN